MKRLLAFVAMLIPLVTTAGIYKLKGAVVGFMQWKDQSRCYVAIKDSANAYYSHGYHYVEDGKLCSMANAAFLTGAKVWATAETRDTGATNEIRTIEMLRDGTLPYWPPYGARHSGQAAQ